jgi:hypothetical protein
VNHPLSAESEGRERLSILDRNPIELTCPQCGHKHQKTIGWLKANDNFACVCGINIVLDTDEFVKSLREIDDALDRIPRNIVIKL